MTYFRQAINGVSWVGALRGVSRVISFLKSAILARILVPSQFGIFGIASLILAFLETLTDTGINIFLIQEKDDIDDFVDTSWIVSILRGTIIFLLIVLSAFFVPNFFAVPEAKSLILLISIVPLVRGFINPAIVKFQKELNFRKDFIVRIMIFAFDAGISVYLAYKTNSPLSIIWGLIAGAVLEVILSYLLVKPIPAIKFEIEKLKEVVNRGKWITGAGVFQYLFKQGDDIVVGKLLGSESLGLYQMAYKVATLPITEVAEVVGKVTLPIYVKMSADLKVLKNSMIKTTLGISLVTIPLGLILVIFSNQIIFLVFGEKWLPAAPALQVVSIYSVIRAIINPALIAFLALKKQEYYTATTLVGIVVMGIFIVPLVYKFGIVGAGLSTIVGSLATVPLVVYLSTKLFKT
ncbi:lipopolysaccharide biosynthesis protein [Candidatus Woesebacteria bacterium]|nr:lipopolysaccharide biosynthesis protein [Candidatus Woesebacteria bacterium]